MGENKIDILRKKWGFPLAIIFGMIVWYMPLGHGLTPQGHHALALFTGIFILYLTEAVPLAVTSIAVAPLAVLMGVAKIGPALSSFASSSLFLMFGAFILAAGMIETNLAKRLTYLILKAVGSSTRQITIGVVLTNIMLSFLVPSSTARVAILLPVCISVIELFKGEGRTKFGANLLLTLTMTNCTIAAGILTATVPNPVIIDFIQKAGGPTISYMEWLKIGFPPALLMTIITWAFIQILFKPEEKEIPGGASYVTKSLNEMGPMKYDEIYTLVVFLLVVVGWATGKIIKIDTTTICMAGSLLLFIPKFGVLKWKQASPHINYSILLVVGGGIGLGTLLMKTGASKWLAAQAFQAFGLQALPVILLTIVVMLICQFMHFFFVGTTVMTTAMMPMIIALGVEAGLPPQVLALSAGMIIGGYPVLMFYCTNPNILVYSTGQLTVWDFPKVGIPISVVGCIVYAICAATYWRWIGVFGG